MGQLVADVCARTDLKLNTAAVAEETQSRTELLLVCLWAVTLTGDGAKIGLIFWANDFFWSASHYMYAYACRAECMLERGFLRERGLTMPCVDWPRLTTLLKLFTRSSLDVFVTFVLLGVGNRREQR